MGLKNAANYFGRTPLYYWSGTAFVDTGIKGAVHPFERSLSGWEFSSFKRRVLLVRPETPLLAAHTVIRAGTAGSIYLRGWQNKDTQDDDSYSLIYLLTEAPVQGTLIALTKTTKASGMGGTVTDSTVGQYHCTVDRVNAGSSREFDQLRVTEAVIYLPLNCPVTTDHEFSVEGKRYVIQEIFATDGFKHARAQVKNG